MGCLKEFIAVRNIRIAFTFYQINTQFGVECEEENKEKKVEGRSNKTGRHIKRWRERRRRKKYNARRE
jgi:hypothetical protein